MGKIITQCPSCESTRVHVSKIECEVCQTKFEGSFDIPALLKFSESDLHFILNFVKCSGSLKEMAIQQNVSYPTLRNRLNTLIEAIEKLEIKTKGSKLEILQLLEKGKISASDAAKMLKKL
jgi:hypothetical protein